jgi:hypothetical protein
LVDEPVVYFVAYPLEEGLGKRPGRRVEGVRVELRDLVLRVFPILERDRIQVF